MTATAAVPAFEEFQKIARLTRDCVVTEKIDGTNAQVYFPEDGGPMLVGSRNRWITPDADNANYSGAAYGGISIGGSGKAVEVSSFSLFDEAMKGVREAAARVGGLVNATTAMNDAIFGSPPTSGDKVTGIGANRIQSNRANDLRESLSALHATISDLEQQVERLRAL